MLLYSKKLACLVVCIVLLGHTLASAQTKTTNLWNVEFRYWFSDSSPAVAPNGNIYVGCLLGKLFAANSNGIVQRTFRTQSDIKSSPAIGQDGTAYFGSRDRSLYALSPAGKRK